MAVQVSHEALAEQLIPPPYLKISRQWRLLILGLAIVERSCGESRSTWEEGYPARSFSSLVLR
jgi:hypothetical protein